MQHDQIDRQRSPVVHAIVLLARALVIEQRIGLAGPMRRACRGYREFASAEVERALEAGAFALSLRPRRRRS